MAGANDGVLTLHTDLDEGTPEYRCNELTIATLIGVEYAARALLPPTEEQSNVGTLLASIGRASAAARDLHHGLASPVASNVGGFDGNLVAGDVEHELNFIEGLLDSASLDEAVDPEAVAIRAGIASDIHDAVALVASLTTAAGRRSRLAVILPRIVGLGALLDRADRNAERLLRIVSDTPAVVRSVHPLPFAIKVDTGPLLGAPLGRDPDEIVGWFATVFPSRPRVNETAPLQAAHVAVNAVALGATTRDALDVVSRYGWTVERRD